MSPSMLDHVAIPSFGEQLLFIGLDGYWEQGSRYGKSPFVFDAYMDSVVVPHQREFGPLQYTIGSVGPGPGKIILWLALRCIPTDRLPGYVSCEGQ
jgi:hypothetical protein